MLFCYLDSYRLKKNFKAADTVDTQYRHGMARAVRLFCQASAGVLTSQLECSSVTAGSVGCV